MINPLVEYYRCEEKLADFYRTARLSDSSGFFRWGQQVCFGRSSCGKPAQSVHDPLHNCDNCLQIPSRDEPMLLPFEPQQIITNLRMELYAASPAPSRFARISKELLHRGYYSVRPWLSLRVRRHFQKLHLNLTRNGRFPQWPVDTTVDTLAEELLRLAMLAKKRASIPFIWFWPEGKTSAVIMTHDVETGSGLDFCESLMDLNDSLGFKSSFQVIPEGRYFVPPSLLARIRSRGFEVNVHDLNHDGHLFRDRCEFLRRVSRINGYLQEFGAEGFRSGVMYRNQLWYEDLKASYDMSVPNAAHLDPQKGGCCTVMPYFVGDVLEIPVTTTQDYSLFNILDDYSIALWQREIETIREKNGLISFIVHPDYVIEDRPRATYRALLEHLNDLRAQSDIWFALPRDVNEWWRQRSAMKLVRNGDSWSVVGQGAERARLAYAHLADDTIEYSFEPAASACRVAAGT